MSTSTSSAIPSIAPYSPPPLRKAIYLGPFVHSASLTKLDICPHGAIGVDEAGIIRFIRREASAKAISDAVASIQAEAEHEWHDASIVNFPRGRKGFFFPGFIDTHTHAPQSPNCGLFGKSTLLSWLQTYTFPLESSFASPQRAARVYDNFVQRTLAHGTTTCAYYATIHVEATNLLAETCLRRGQRALVGRVCMDRAATCPPTYKDASAASALRDTQASIAHMRALDPHAHLLRPVITPRFAPSCTPACLSSLGHLARSTNPPTPIQTHLSENRSEIALVRDLFPASASYAHVYDAFHLLTPHTILAHAIHLSDEELGLVKRRGAKISHCPASNVALGSGCAPVREWLDRGLCVGLGTDVSGGWSASLLEACRMAVWVSRVRGMGGNNGKEKEGEEEGAGGGLDKGEGGGAKEKEGEDRDAAHYSKILSTEEVLHLATRGGAAVVGLADKVGAFEVGWEWDAQMVVLGEEVGGEGGGEGEGGEQGARGVREGERRVGEGVFEQRTINPVPLFGFETLPDLVEKWVYCGDDRNTVGVWVGGRRVV